MARYRRIDGYKQGMPDVGWWRGQIAKGKEWRKKVASEPSWNIWRSYYRGHWPKNHMLPVNIFYRMVRTIVPRIYFRNPSLSVQATKPGMEQQLFAQLIERIDNKLIRTMDVKNQMKKMIQNAFFFGTGAGQLGYGAAYTPTPDPLETAAPTEQHGVKFNRKVEFNQLVVPNMPWFMSTHPGALVVPADLPAFEETPWVATCFKRNVHDVKADERFEYTEQLKGGSTGSSPNLKPDEVEFYQIRDMRTGKVIVISAYGGGEEPKPHIYEDDALQNNNRPNIYPLIFNPDDEVFWGVPDSLILEPQQLEINEIRTLQMQHRRMSLLKLIYKDRALDPDQLDKLLNGDVLSAIKINGGFELTDLEFAEVAHIPEGLIMSDQMVQQDVRDMFGVSVNQSGNFASQRSHNAPTAYEAQIVQAASEIRVDERRDLCADVLVKIFEDVNVLVFNEWENEQVVQVMGPDSVPYWVAFKPAMLKAARYELMIDPDSSVPETKDLRRQKADQVYNVLKQNPLIDPTLLTKYYLREMHGVQYDNLMRTMQQNAQAGVPGSTPENPMQPGQMLQMMAQPPKPAGG